MTKIDKGKPGPKLRLVKTRTCIDEGWDEVEALLGEDIRKEMAVNPGFKRTLQTTYAMGVAVCMKNVWTCFPKGTMLGNRARGQLMRLSTAVGAFVNPRIKRGIPEPPPGASQ